VTALRYTHELGGFNMALGAGYTVNTDEIIQAFISRHKDSGFGIAQEIDKAAMTLWLKYRQHDGELTGGPFDGGLDAFFYVGTGGIIYF
jgi:hypothetical protein